MAIRFLRDQSILAFLILLLRSPCASSSGVRVWKG